MITVYGLRNCDTCRKAQAWLNENAHEFRFHDLRADGLPAGAVASWCAQVGWETLLNRRSTTWRGLSDADRDGLNAAKAEQLLTANPTLIKRPVFEIEGEILVGFSDQVKTALNNSVVGR